MGAVATAAAVGIAGCTKEAQALESAMAPVVRYVDGLADASGAVSDAIADNGKTFKQNYGALKTYIQDLSTEIPRTTGPANGHERRAGTIWHWGRPAANNGVSA